MEILNKSTIVTGSASSGKSKFISEFLSNNNQDFIVKIDGRQKITNFLFMPCNEFTQTIVVTDVKNTDMLYFIYDSIVNGTIVNKQSKPPFKIFPKFILECSKEQFPLHFFEFNPKSFIHRNFEIIDVDVLQTIK